MISSINILGLAAGIAFTLLIAGYVWSEVNVNTQLRNADHQYIIQSKWKNPNMGIELTSLGPLAKALKDQYPTLVANYYRWDGVTSNVSKGDKAFREGLQICDSTMLNMYGFSLAHGDIRTAFTAPFSVIITEERAKKYFGKTEVIGQTLTIESFSGGKHDFMVTGVLKRPGQNSVTFLTDDNDNQFYIPVSNLAFFGRDMETWLNQYIVSYIELKPGVDPSDLKKPMAKLIKENAQSQVSENMEAYLLPLDEYYLNANNGLIKKLLYTLSFIALFILVMAIVNFVNITISSSSSRIREIGIRKVMGGMRKQLMIQFLAESVMLVCIATGLALVLYQLAKPILSVVLAKQLLSINTFPWFFIFIPFILAILIGLLAGIYPALILSSMKSVDSLKGKLKGVKEKVWLRKSLIAFQFSTAAIVLIGAYIISKQVNLFFSKDIGYNKEYIVSAQLPRNWTLQGVRNMEGIRKQFAAMQEVNDVTLSFEVPDGNSSGSIALYNASADSTTAIASQLITTDEYYARTFNIPMVAGKFFSDPGAFTDSFKLVINETGAKSLGYKVAEEAIGKQVKTPNGNNTIFTIAGVTKDFHFGSMKQNIPPITFMHVGINTIFRVLSFKLKPGNLSNCLQTLQSKWATLLPGVPFEYSFMDNTLAKLYKTEIQLKKASYTATILSLLIVLLGILGLVSLSIQKRVKEIGIRKVLGASLPGIVSLFVKEFMIVIAAASFIACPLAYWVMSNWLDNYVYRISISPIPFAMAIGCLIALTLLIILIRIFRSAAMNPVKSLRAE
ncbi:MAG: ABC transporter permease [Chitinophagaceae bacterium]